MGDTHTEASPGAWTGRVSWAAPVRPLQLSFPRVLPPSCPWDTPGENGLLCFTCLYITYLL